MHTNAIDRRRLSLADVEKWAALSGGALLLFAGARRRSPMLALTAAPLLYRGVTGHWPALNGADDTRRALSGDRGVHIRESVRLEMPVAEVYGFWRRLENLPRFMTHLEEVTETGNGRSHWVAAGPAGVEVEWDAEIINEVDNQVIGWQSLPGSDIATAGSVNFEEIRGGRGTQVNVHLQYSAPAGKAGARIASLFRQDPSQIVREDLRHFKQLLEAGEIPQGEIPENGMSQNQNSASL